MHHVDRINVDLKAPKVHSRAPTVLKASLVPSRTARCREDLAHIRLSMKDSDLGFQAQLFKIFVVVPSLLAGGWVLHTRKSNRVHRMSTRTDQKAHAIHHTCHHTKVILNRLCHTQTFQRLF